jgi:hypothetical protein
MGRTRQKPGGLPHQLVSDDDTPVYGIEYLTPDLNPADRHYEPLMKTKDARLWFAEKEQAQDYLEALARTVHHFSGRVVVLEER